MEFVRLLRTIPTAIAAAGLMGGAVWAQSSEVKELRFQFDPPPAKIRPGESIAVQVQVWGDLVDKEGNRRSGRLREVATIRVPQGQGFASKPLRFQGKDNGEFISNSGAVASIFNSIAGRFTEKDAVLYTAPAQPGRYRIEAEKGAVKATAEIEVAEDAPTRNVAQTQHFAKEPDTNPYRKLAEHWAPFVAQETWWQPKSDIPTRFDFDGDWDGDNNWENADTGTSQAYVYYAAVETPTHWFLHYNFFHPRDYSDNCIVGTCHENDNEGIILTIRKGAPGEFGKLEVMETLAHNNVYSYTNETRLRKGVHNIDGKIELFEGRRPMVFLEAGGHGALGTDGEHSLFSGAKMEFKSGTGMTFVYRGVAERAKTSNDRLIGYDLIPIESTWWTRAKSRSGGKTFDAEYVYEPLGGRPGRGLRFQGSFLGRKHGANKAKPFWGWHDERSRRAKALNTGQWALDPAYSVTRNLTWPADLPVDLNYTYNPYLGVEGSPSAPQTVATVSISPGTPSVTSPTGSGVVSGSNGSGGDPIAAAAAAAALAASGGSATGTPAPAAGAAVAAGPGSCTIEAWIDGSVVISVQQSTVAYQVEAGQAEREATVRCEPPMPAAALRKVEVRKLSGRGDVKLVEQPTGWNGFTVRIRVDDKARGADRYRMTLSWEP